MDGRLMGRPLGSTVHTQAVVMGEKGDVGVLVTALLMS